MILSAPGLHGPGRCLPLTANGAACQTGLRHLAGK